MIKEDYPDSRSVAALQEETSSADDSVLPSVTMIGILTQLAHRKRLIAIVIGASMFAGVGASLLLPVRYTATTKLLTPQQTQSSASLLMSQLSSSGVGSLAAAAGGGLGLRNPNDIYIGMLESRPVADAIIQQFGLANEYNSKNITNASRILAARTRIISERSGFISISVTDKDKKRAADIANAYTEQLRALTRTLAVTEASQRRLYYEGQLKDAKEALGKAEMNFQQVQQNKGMIQLDAQSKAMIESLTDLRAKVTAKEIEVQALRSYSTERNPDVQLAERELSSLRAAVAQMEQRSHSSGFTDIGMKDVPSASFEYLNAQHEVLYRQTLFDLLIKQYDAARLDEAKDAAIIQVIEPAIPPEQRSSPRRTLTVLTFSVFGFLGGLAYALGRGYTRRYPEFSQSLIEFRSALLSR